jgi:hypothetical protein
LKPVTLIAKGALTVIVEGNLGWLKNKIFMWDVPV